MKKALGGLLLIVLTGALAVSVSLGQGTPSTDEILDRIDAEADRLLGDGLIALFRTYNEYDDGTDYETLTAALQAPDKSLMYILEPWDAEGQVYLVVVETDEAGEETTRIWYYSPYIYAVPKEMVSEEERRSGFGGSAMSFESMADEDVRADYDTVLLGEEALPVGDVERMTYVIEATAKPGIEDEFVRTVMWVDSEAFVVLKMEGYNEVGNKTLTMSVAELGEFEGIVTTDVMIVDNRRLGTTSTYTISDRRRPEGGFPEGLFTPEGVVAFDPADWGFSTE